MTDADWLRAVAAAPDDPLVRLAYADWLDDHGDPRAEVLRLDVELAGQLARGRFTPALVSRLVAVTPAATSEWRTAVCRVPTTFDGWHDFHYCDCAAPTAHAPALFGRDAEGRHLLVRQPSDPTEVDAICRAARECDGGAVHFVGADPVVERLLGHDETRFSRPYVPPPPPPPPPPVPRLYGGFGIGVGTGRMVEAEQPPSLRTMAVIALLIWVLGCGGPLALLFAR